MRTSIDNWFTLNQENDLNNVLQFIDQVPRHLDNLFDDPVFKDLLADDYESNGVSYDLFLHALKDASERLWNELRQFRINLSIENVFDREEFVFQANDTLQQIGFTGASLVLKARVLNTFWRKAVKAGNGIISFAIHPVVKIIRKFLNLLNSILGSLKGLIPGIDGIKEIKDIGENYLSLAEESDKR